MHSLGLFCLSLLSSPLLWAGDLVFEKTLIEVSAAPDQDLVTADFNFAVNGEGSADIERYDAPCSCLEARISDGGRLVWQPGEKGSVRGLFKVGNFRGITDKQISLLMKDGKRHELTVRLSMPELLTIQPKTLKWSQGEERVTQSFLLTVTGEDPMKILEVSGTSEQKFPFELETLEEGRRYRITVTPEETETRGFGLLRIKTDSKYVKHQTYQAYTVVAKSAARGEL